MEIISGKSLTAFELADKVQLAVKNYVIDSLNDGEVIIKSNYSSLNYKDCLSATGNRGVTRQYPHIPGIDVSGIIYQSKSSNFKKGDKILATGYDLGMNTYGGFSEYVKINADWCLKLPQNLSLKQAMIFGTAGLTAALSVNAINQFKADFQNKNAIVTGALGGVGLLAALLLKKQKYNVTISSRDVNNSLFKQYNFNNYIDFDKISQISSKPLLNRQFDIAIDTLGGDILANLLKIIDYHGVIASCGNVKGNELNSTIFPFILRGVKLLGISSSNALMHNRLAAWNLLAKNNDIIDNEFYNEIKLENLPEYIKMMFDGKHSGRTIIKFDE